MTGRDICQGVNKTTTEIKFSFQFGSPQFEKKVSRDLYIFLISSDSIVGEAT
jgi:hypothetical protein